MKTNILNKITAGLAAALITPAFGIEAPADNAPPPVAAADNTNSAPASKPLRFEPLNEPKKQADAPATAFLGIVTADVPEMLSEHLELKEDEGIIVRSLMPDGPAAKAGITVHDVITRVDDKVIKSPADISACIASHKPDDTVTLELIHKGKPAKLEIKLGNRPPDVASALPQPMDQLNLDEFPKDLADRIRGAIEGNIGGLDLQAGDDASGLPQMGDAMKELKKHMQKALGADPAPNAGGIHMQSGATLRMKDPQGSIEIKSNNNRKEVTIRDNDDKVVWSGPWDTEQDKAAAPPDVRKRVDSLNLDPNFKGNGLRFHMGPGAAPDADGP